MPSLAMETQLRHAVIDRLIAASLRDGKPAREATLERWRSLGSPPEVPAAAPTHDKSASADLLQT